MTTTKLHQLLAVEKSVKTAAAAATNSAYHAFQKSIELFNGLSRVYSPRDEDGETLPAENKKVTFQVDGLLTELRDPLVRLLDVTAQKDWANCTAKADVVVDGQTLIEDAPVSYLLFLEKQLTDLGTLIKSVPVLEASENWELDPQTGLYRSARYQTIRSKKVYRNHVLAVATEKHPAQVQVYQEDVPAGTWETVKFSAAVPLVRRRRMSDQQEKLLAAVRFARERANEQAVPDEVRPGDTVFDFVFA